MKIEKLIMIIGFIVFFVIALLLVNTSNVLAQEPTITATPKGTMTPYPTNNNLTPAPGSGCPASMPENVTANWYKNCGVCFEDYDPLATGTPIPSETPDAEITHTPTDTTTPTITPTGKWYGYGAPISISRSSPNMELADFGIISKNDYCPGGKISGIHITSNHSHLWHTLNDYQWWEFYNGTNFYWGVDDPASYNLSAALFPGQSRENHPSNLLDNTHYKVALYDTNFSGTIDLVICQGYNHPQTPTPTPTPTLQPEVCVPETEYEVITSMESFRSGLKTVGDGKISYYRIFPYDVGSYKSLYESDLYNKNFEINMELSNVSYFQFEKTEEDLDVFYGKHKISFYDCSDQSLGSYETNDEFDKTRSWSFPTATSLCRVVVETIDNGLEKQFSSDGVSSDGCKQVDCYARSSLTDFYSEDSPFGIDMGSWGTTQCKLIFPGIDLSGLGDAMQDAIDFIKIDITVPDFPNIPWINLCVHYWYLPRIKIFDFEIPIGNILLIAILPSIFKSIGGRKSK